MTPDRLAEILDYLDLTPRLLATNEGYDPRLVRRWQQGAVPIPHEVAAWLEAMYAAALEFPLSIDAPGVLDALVRIVGDSPEQQPGWSIVPREAA